MKKSSSDDTSKSKSKTDWDALKKMTDKDIDFSDSPEFAEAWFKKAKLLLPKDKERISICLDKDILGFFKKAGAGYQTKINAILRAYIETFKEIRKTKTA
jgi:uncharacterized protein (DUF4415 family)